MELVNVEDFEKELEKEKEQKKETSSPNTSGRTLTPADGMAFWEQYYGADNWPQDYHGY